MADLDPVTQKFTADVSDYIRKLQEATEETRHFAEQVQQATRDLLAMAAAADVAGKEVAKLKDKMADANLTDAKTADTLAEVRTRLDDVKSAGDDLHDSTVRITDDVKQAGEETKKFGEDLKTAREDLRQSSEATDRATERYGRFRETLGSVIERIGGFHTALIGLFEKEKEIEEEGGGEGSGVGGGRTGFFANMAMQISRLTAVSEEGEVSLSALAGSVGAFGAGALVLAPIIAGLVTWVAALGAGFLAAGMGIGAFALLAKPAIEKVTGALNDNRKQLAKLDPDEREAVKGIRSLKDAYEAMSKAFEPMAFKVLNDGLKIANELLPQIKPFADTAATALDGLLKKLDKFFAPQQKAPNLPQDILHGNKVTDAPSLTGWQKFMQYMHELEGPAITAIGKGLGQVAGAVARMLESFSKKDVVHAINVLFKTLVVILDGVTHAIHQVMNMWDDLSAAYKNSKNWIMDVIRWQMQMYHDVVKAVKTMVHDVAKDFDDMRHDVAKSWDSMRHDTLSKLNQIKHDVASGIDQVREKIVSVGHTIEHDWDTFWGRVVSFARTVPHKIVSAFASLPGMLFSAGANAIRHLASGMLSAIGSVISAGASIASKVAGFFGLSPAKWGELSGSGAPEIRGRHFAEELARGILQGAPQVHAAVNSLSGLLGGKTSTTTLATPVSSPQFHISVPIAMAPGMGAVTSPAFLQGIQPVVQEAILRYVQLNQSNGLFAFGRRS